MKKGIYKPSSWSYQGKRPGQVRSSAQTFAIVFVAGCVLLFIIAATKIWHHYQVKQHPQTTINK